MKKLILFAIYTVLLCNARAQEEKTYHENEQLESIGNYLNGEKTGEWKTFHDNGTLLKQINYVNGRREF